MRACSAALREPLCALCVKGEFPNSQISLTEADVGASVASCPDTPAKRITLIQNEHRFAGNESSAGDARGYFACRRFKPMEFAGERAADDALLDPGTALGKFAVGCQTSQLGTGACPARGPIVSFAGAL